MGCVAIKDTDKAFKLALEIQNTLESVDQRYMAADGPVTPTRNEITGSELRLIYKNSLKIKALLTR